MFLSPGVRLQIIYLDINNLFVKIKSFSPRENQNIKIKIKSNTGYIRTIENKITQLIKNPKFRIKSGDSENDKIISEYLLITLEKSANMDIIK